MKFCPVCKTSYDEEILRFCTKDGTPLVEDAQPNFTAMPSREDLGEETVIRRKTPPPQIPSTAQPLPDFDEPERISSPRIVIPMTDEPVVEEEIPRRREGVRTMTTESVRRQPPPRESNTAMVVALTVLGTILVLGIGGGIVYLLRDQGSESNQNANYNTNMNSIDLNINSGLAVDNSLANFNSSISSSNNTNSNSNSNSNLNANANANSKTPTPTRTPTPTPTPDEDEVETNTNSRPNSNIILPPSPSVTGTPFPKPSVRPSAPPTPRPSPPLNEPANRPAVNAGVLNSRAVSLPKPAYPSVARQMRANGRIAVEVSLDESGNVTSARATGGNPLLRSSAEAAARQSKFTPVRMNNQPVSAIGIVLYNFTAD